MPKARSSFKYLPNESSHHVLCHSTFSGPWEGMTKEELDEAREVLFQHAEFACLEILAFSLGSRSFDILLKVPSELDLSLEEMVRRLETGFSSVAFQSIKADLESGNPAAKERIRQNFGCVSYFLKRFKQVLTRSYHGRRNTSGVLWESRYDSTLVEPGHATRVVSAWIDHGCTRETPSLPPEENPHCTIGAAIAGNRKSREMIRGVFGDHAAKAKWPSILKAWQQFVSSEPENAKTRVSNLAGKAPLSRPSLLRFPVYHFHSGLAIGSHDFVQRLFEHNRGFFSEGRETGPRFITGQNDPDLYTLRDKGDLRKPPRAARLKRSMDQERSAP